MNLVVSLFDNPNKDERVLYAQYWQNKLKGNKDIPFPDELVEEVAGLTDGFSFAYLKECLFVLPRPLLLSQYSFMSSP